MYHNDIIFCKVAAATEEEKDLEDMDPELVENDCDSNEDVFTWDKLIEDRELWD